MNFWHRFAQLTRVLDRALSTEPYLVLDEDCPRYSVYAYPSGRIVCHPSDRRLGAKVLADHSQEDR